jgi:GMP synthase (glutamine-hydrolysing)
LQNNPEIIPFVEEKIVILDFGSQYTQLIARRVRELNVYCEIWPFNSGKITDSTVKGIILSGSPSSVRDQNAPIPNLKDSKGKIPILGICNIYRTITEVRLRLLTAANTEEQILMLLIPTVNFLKE